MRTLVHEIPSYDPGALDWFYGVIGNTTNKTITATTMAYPETTPYATGVTVDGSVVTIRTPDEAKTLYYQCSAHAGMGNGCNVSATPASTATVNVATTVLPPTITLQGDATVSMTQGDAYSDGGATVDDGSALVVGGMVDDQTGPARTPSRTTRRTRGCGCRGDAHRHGQAAVTGAALLSVPENSPDWSYDLANLLAVSGTTATWAVTEGGAGLTINNNTLGFATYPTPDFEDPSATKQWTATLVATSNGVESDPVTVTLDLANVDEPPQFGANATVSAEVTSGVANNAVATLSTTDPDATDTVMYTMDSGPRDSRWTATPSSTTERPSTATWTSPSPRATSTPSPSAPRRAAATRSTSTASRRPALNLMANGTYRFDQSDGTNYAPPTLVQWDIDGAYGSGWVSSSPATFTTMAADGEMACIPRLRSPSS